MRMKKQLYGAFWISAALLILLCPAAGALPLLDVEAAVGGWQVSTSGDAAYGPSGDLLDVEEIFDAGRENHFTGRLKMELSLPLIPAFYLMATPLEYEATNVSAASFRFGGMQIDPFEAFDSRLRLDHYDFCLFYHVPLVRGITLDRLALEAGLNVRVIEAEAAISQDGRRQAWEETLTVPMVYLGLFFQPFESLGLEAEARAISYDDYEVLSLIGRVRADVYGPVFVAGGYRYDTYDLEEDDFSVNADFSGPFLETGLRF